MTREEINILQDIVDIYEKEDMYPLLKDKQIRVLKRAIEALEAQEWIPCSEILPDAEYGESDTVLVTKCWGKDELTRFVETAMFNGGNWCEPTGECLTVTKVIAWMPLPAPYKEENDVDVPRG